MNKIADTVTGTRNFLEEVRAELKKCAWPTRPELIDSTIVVIISLVILGFYVTVADYLLIDQFLNLVIR